MSFEQVDDPEFDSLAARLRAKRERSAARAAEHAPIQRAEYQQEQPSGYFDRVQRAVLDASGYRNARALAAMAEGRAPMGLDGLLTAGEVDAMRRMAGGHLQAVLARDAARRAYRPARNVAEQVSRTAAAIGRSGVSDTLEHRLPTAHNRWGAHDRGRHAAPDDATVILPRQSAATHGRHAADRPPNGDEATIPLRRPDADATARLSLAAIRAAGGLAQHHGDDAATVVIRPAYADSDPTVVINRPTEAVNGVPTDHTVVLPTATDATMVIPRLDNGGQPGYPINYRAYPS